VTDSGGGRSGKPALYRQVALLTSIGTSFAVTSAGGFVIGNWLDGKLATRPWLTLVLGLMGVAGAFANLLRTLAAVDRIEKSKREGSEPTGSGEPPRSTEQE
jgi:F0F1-type ATP synthase assembly protein I